MLGLQVQILNAAILISDAVLYARGYSSDLYDQIAAASMFVAVSSIIISGLIEASKNYRSIVNESK